MEPRLSVTQIATPKITPDGLPQGWSHDVRPDVSESGTDRDVAPVRALRATIASVDRGPCLYLGPRGQRCTKRAIDGGFCTAHCPSAPKGAATNPRRYLAAAAAIVGILWPYLDFAVRELIRWARSH